MNIIGSFKGSLVGLIAAGTLAILSTPLAFAHGGGGGGHGGHFGGGHGFAPHEGAHFGRQSSHRGHFGYGGPYPYGGAYWYDYPSNDDYDYDYDDGEPSEAQASPSQAVPTEEIIGGVQEALAKLGYYHGEVDGLVGPGTQKAIGWFQSVEKLAVTGRIDDPTLQALKIMEESGFKASR